MYATTVYTDENITMKGKVVIITGCNTGIGLYTCKILAKNGAHVIMAVRSKEKGENALQEIKSIFPASQLTLLLVDLSDLSSVNEFVNQFKKLNLPLHVLINNAGVATTIDNANELEPMFATNHLGHYLLTKKLLPFLKNSNTKEDPGRIVILSSDAHSMVAPDINQETLERFTKLPMKKTSYFVMASTLMQYGFTKLCNIYHAQYLKESLRNDNVVVFSIHPGTVRSDMDREIYNLPLAMKIVVVPLLVTLQFLFFKDTRAGAQTSIFAASDPKAIEYNGLYLDNSKPKNITTLAQDKLVQQALIDLSENLISKYN